MQQRVTAAMQRIGELEGVVARSGSGVPAAAGGGGGANGGGGGLGLGLLEPMGSGSLVLAQQLGSPARGMPRSPLRLSAVDDVRIVVRDKARRSLNAKLQASPHRQGARRRAMRLPGSWPSSCLCLQSLARARDKDNTCCGIGTSGRRGGRVDGVAAWWGSLLAGVGVGGLLVAAASWLPVHPPLPVDPTPLHPAGRAPTVAGWTWGQPTPPPAPAATTVPEPLPWPPGWLVLVLVRSSSSSSSLTSRPPAAEPAPRPPLLLRRRRTRTRRRTTSTTRWAAGRCCLTLRPAVALHCAP